MTFAQQIVNFLIAQGPTILVLGYAYMNGKVIRANSNAQILQLQKDIALAHAKIEAKYPSSASNVDTINAILGADSGKPSQ